MRTSALFCCLFTLGCNAGTESKVAPSPETGVAVSSAEISVPPTTARSETPPGPAKQVWTDWPTFLGPTANSVSPETGIIAPWPKDGLRKVWSAEVGNGYVVPAISDGRAFLFDRGADKLRLRCLKSTTGEQLWQFEYASSYEDFYGYDDGPRCLPVVDGDRVYIYGPEGMLHCLSAAKGEVLWKANLKQSFGVVQNFFGVGSTPVIEGDLLLVQVGGSPPDSPPIHSGKVQPNGSAIVAFEKLTGKLRYQAGDDLASYSSPTLATINGRRWCFLLARGGLIGFDPASGKIDFRYPWRARVLESVNASKPVVVGDQVFITECYGVGGSLLKVKPGGYDVVWSDADKGRAKSMMCHWMTPIYHNGYLYGSSGRHLPEAELRCIEFATGKVKWSEKGLTRSSLLMADGHFLCLGEDGELRLLKVNSEKYEEISRMRVRRTEEIGPALQKHPYWAAPVLSHGLLYIRGEGQLLCLELIPQKTP